MEKRWFSKAFLSISVCNHQPTNVPEKKQQEKNQKAGDTKADFFFKDRVSLYNPELPEAHYVY